MSSLIFSAKAKRLILSCLTERRQHWDAARRGPNATDDMIARLSGDIAYLDNVITLVELVPLEVKRPQAQQQTVVQSEPLRPAPR